MLPWLAACVALAAVSLVLPFALVFDPWAWLVWGQELASLSLDTGGGPSWKPLPVLVDAVFAPLGEAAPALWLVVSRTGWLMVAVLAWRLAARLSASSPPRERLVAGALGAAGVVLLWDASTPWLRQFAGGMSEPLLAAFALGTIDRHLERRPGQALALLLLASLLRPEAWAFLAGYAAFTWSRDPGLRPVALALCLLVPALWLVPDALGSGDPFTGAGRARVDGLSAGGTVDALRRAGELPLLASWVGAALAVASGLRRGERALLALAALGLAWIALVAAMATFGYAGLARFSAPAGALVAVLGGVGLARLSGALGSLLRGPRPAVLVAAVLAAALLTGQGALRVGELPGVVQRASTFGRSVDDLFSLVDRVGRERMLACGKVTVDDALVVPALAWKLDLPLKRVSGTARPSRGSSVTVLSPQATHAVRERAASGGHQLAALGSWAAYAVSCAAPPDERGA